MGSTPASLRLDDVANPNVSPEALLTNLLPELPCPQPVEDAGNDTVYRIALHSVVQVIMLVGPLFAEWKRLNFSRNFEILSHVVGQLRRISEQIGAMGAAARDATDENYEVVYRD